jgi:hypothetical protein
MSEWVIKTSVHRLSHITSPIGWDKELEFLVSVVGREIFICRFSLIPSLQDPALD